MAWTDSLIRLGNYEIEALRKRLGAILEQRGHLNQRLAALDAEASRETAHAKQDAEAGWYLIGFREGWKQRRAAIEADLRTLAVEEQGARDALIEAFEGLKKVEKTAEAMAAAKAKEVTRRENQALDEQALRRRTAG